MQAYITREVNRPCKQWIHDVLLCRRETERVKLRTLDFVLLPDIDCISKRYRFDSKFDFNLKFDSKTDSKFDSRFDSKFDSKTDSKIDFRRTEIALTQLTDSKIDFRRTENALAQLNDSKIDFRRTENALAQLTDPNHPNYNLNGKLNLITFSPDSTGRMGNAERTWSA